MATKTALTKRLIRRLEVQRDVDTNVDMYLNKDNRPLPPSRRTYGPWDFVGLWMVTGSFNVGGVCSYFVFKLCYCLTKIFLPSE